jgi:hypothetical protein
MISYIDSPADLQILLERGKCNWFFDRGEYATGKGYGV